MALLEADVNFKVVKAFIDRVRDRAVDQEVLKSLTPAQQVVRIVRDEMLALFGDTTGGLPASQAHPRVDPAAGSSGLGQDDDRRKARTLAGQAGAASDSGVDRRSAAGRDRAVERRRQAGWRSASTIPAGDLDPVRRASGAMTEAKNSGFDTVIVDTAGRLHIDDELMDELQAIKPAVEPTDRLYVADAMTGQDAIKSAGEFNRRIGITGVVLSKMDGDARGGAALSVVGVVGVPIAFVGSGERLQDLEPFHPDRVVSRVLGMGDVLSLIEKAEEAVSVEDAAKLEEKLRLDDFTLEDFRDQLRTIKKMGPLEQIIGMLPGMGAMKELRRAREGRRQAARSHRGDHQLDDAAGAAEPPVINGSRRKRIAQGSGHLGRGNQPAAEAVHADEEDAEGDGRHGRPGEEGAAWG